MIHQTDDVIENMNDWSKEQHAKSGLTERVRESKMTMEEAEEMVLAFIREHTDEGVAQLTGNAVYTDMIFIQKYMPKITAHLHYRLLDVSTVKEICRRWFPREFRKKPRKQMNHTAMSDIEESLEELKYYRAKIFKKVKPQR